MSRKTEEEPIDQSNDGSFVCTKCSHVWIPRNPKKPPISCPHCRSTLWMRPLKHHTCARCGHEWKTSAYNTRRCPDCGSYHWTNSPKKYNCTKCDHTWAGKTDEPPKRCPNCRSTVWNVHKKSGGPPPESYEPVASSIHSAVIGEKNVKKILLLYRKGNSCTSISLAMDLSFDMVFDVVSNEYPLAKIRS